SVIFVQQKIAKLGVAYASGILQHRLEHWLQLAGRIADDLEHIGGSGLLLQRLAQLVEPARVLPGDNRLAGKSLDQLDLLGGEGANLLAIDADGSDQLVLLQHGNAQDSASSTENDKRMLRVRRIGSDVSDMVDLLGAGDQVEAASRARPNHGF